MTLSDTGRAMGRASYLIGVLCFSVSAWAAVGSNPVRNEELRVGGGPSETVDGGADIDKAGNLDSSGYLSGASVKLRNAAYRATITWPTATANRAVTLPDADGEISLLGQTISSTEIIDGTIVTADLADNSVTTGKILDGTILNADISASAAIVPSKFSVSGADEGDVLTVDSGVAVWAAPEAGLTSVNLDDIGQSGATTGQVPIWGGSAWAPQTMTGTYIADGGIALIDLAGDSVNSSKIVDGAIVNADVNAAAAVAVSKLAAGTSEQVLITSGSTPTWSTVSSTGITDGTIVNADINASAAIGLGKISTGAGTNGQVLTLVAGMWAPADASSISGAVTGPGSTTDNAIARMNGTGGYTIQGYSGNTPTIDDVGLLDVPGGAEFGGNVDIDAGTLLLSGGTGLYYRRDDELRWAIVYSTGAETGSSGETDLLLNAYDNDGNYLNTALTAHRTAASGVEVGTNSAPRPLYVKGDIYAGTSDIQVTTSGKVRLQALDASGATNGQFISLVAGVWTPTSGGSVDWANPGSIGATTPNAAAFTTLTASGTTTLNGSMVFGDAAADTVHFDANVIDFEGATADGFETIFTPYDTGVDIAVAGWRVAGTAKNRTVYWLSAASGTPTTSGGATDPALDANDRWYIDYDTTGDAAFWQVVLPEDFDGTVDRATVFWYQTGSTAAITWTIDCAIMGDGDNTNTAYGTDYASAADTPGATDAVQYIAINSPSNLFGAASNAIKIVNIRCVATGTYTTNHPRLLGILIET